MIVTLAAAAVERVAVAARGRAHPGDAARRREQPRLEVDSPGDQEDSGRGTIFTTTTVHRRNADLNAFKPDWSRYDVVVLNYNTGIAAMRRVAAERKRSFERYVSTGGGLVRFTPPTTGFAGWPSSTR